VDPNSANQRWSKWFITIYTGGTKAPAFADVKANCARFARKGFGSASNMHIEVQRRPTYAGGRRDVVLIQVLTEGQPVHDPGYVAYMRASWTRFAIAGWGNGTRVELDAKLMAGSRQDGSPTDQLIIAAPIAVEDTLYEKLRPLRRLRNLFRRAPDGGR
jgi:hypothetical protein